MAELFENLGINWKLLLAQAVNFLLVLWVLNKFVFKRLLKFLEERRDKIAKGLVFSEKAKLELQRTEQARHRILSDARNQGELILQEFKTAAKKARGSNAFGSKNETGNPCSNGSKRG